MSHHRFESTRNRISVPLLAADCQFCWLDAARVEVAATQRIKRASGTDLPCSWNHDRPERQKSGPRRVAGTGTRILTPPSQVGQPLKRNATTPEGIRARSGSGLEEPAVPGGAEQACFRPDRQRLYNQEATVYANAHRWVLTTKQGSSNDPSMSLKN